MDFQDLVFEPVQYVDIHRLGMPVYHDDNSQSNRYFGSGHHHDKKDEQLGGHVMVILGQSDQQQIDGVQHELDAHENDDRVSADQYTDHAYTEKRQGKPDVVLYGHSLYPAGCFMMMMDRLSFGKLSPFYQ